MHAQQISYFMFPSFSWQARAEGELPMAAPEQSSLNGHVQGISCNPTGPQSTACLLLKEFVSRSLPWDFLLLCFPSLRASIFSRPRSCLPGCGWVCRSRQCGPQRQHHPMRIKHYLGGCGCALQHGGKLRKFQPAADALIGCRWALSQLWSPVRLQRAHAVCCTNAAPSSVL